MYKSFFSSEKKEKIECCCKNAVHWIVGRGTLTRREWKVSLCGSETDTNPIQGGHWTLDKIASLEATLVSNHDSLTHSLASKPFQILELIARTFFPAMPLSWFCIGFPFATNQVKLCKLWKSLSMQQVVEMQRRLHKYTICNVVKLFSSRVVTIFTAISLETA